MGRSRNDAPGPRRPPAPAPPAHALAGRGWLLELDAARPLRPGRPRPARRPANRRRGQAAPATRPLRGARARHRASRRRRARRRLAVHGQDRRSPGSPRTQTGPRGCRTAVARASSPTGAGGRVCQDDGASRWKRPATRQGPSRKPAFAPTATKTARSPAPKAPVQIRGGRDFARRGRLQAVQPCAGRKDRATPVRQRRAAPSPAALQPMRLGAAPSQRLRNRRKDRGLQSNRPS